MARWRLFRLALLAALIGGLAGGAAAVPADVVPLFMPLVRRTPLITTTANVPLSYATHLGGAGGDKAQAVDVGPDGTTVLGGVFVGAIPALSGVAAVSLLGGGDGAVVRFSPAGQPLSLTRIGASVADLEVGAAGQIALCGSFGVAVLNASADAALWSDASRGAVKRCAIGSDGTVAAAVNASVYLYDAAGTPLAAIATGGATSDQDSFDVAVYGPGQSVIVAGFKQKTSSLQVAFLRAWAYTGAEKWASYDFSASAIGAAAKNADTRGRRVAVGRDGKLYFAGSINGGTGASIFSRDPKNVNLTLGAREVTTDTYNTATNTGSISMLWYGRYSPADGALELGQSLLTRKGDGSGNSIGVKAIAADESGRVYIGGDAYFQIQNRSTRQINGATVGAYEGGEAYLLVTSADLRQRHIWTPFVAPGASAGGSPVQAVAVRDGRVAIAATLAKGRHITTAEAVQPQPGALPDAYLGIWNQ